MKLVCYLHMYPPLHMAGSETTVHAAMRAMVARGHEVAVIADRTPEDYVHEGVNVLCLPKHNQQAHVRAYAQDADLLVTHLDCTSLAMSLALDLQKPLVHFIHNDAQLSYWHVDPRVRYKASLVIFNSYWVAEKEKFQEKPWPGDQIVMHPVIEPDRYRCKPGTKITLCNPTDGKGAGTLYKLAERMTCYQFMTVAGIYGEQIAPPNIEPRERVEHMQNSPDFRNVLRKTKVLLMPSNYESYGRCAVEAACAGIPTIAHPTPGLVESLGPAGIFIHRDDIPAWQKEIERLYTDELYYRKRSDLALKLASGLDPDGEFDRLEEALIGTFNKWSDKEELTKMKTWTSDRFIWKTVDGSYRAVDDQRIPFDAVSLAFGIGSAVPKELAIQNGWISPEAKPQEKAVEAPAENKAIESPQENKQRTSRVKKTA